MPGNSFESIVPSGESDGQDSDGRRIAFSRGGALRTGAAGELVLEFSAAEYRYLKLVLRESQFHLLEPVFGAGRFERPS